MSIEGVSHVHSSKSLLSQTKSQEDFNKRRRIRLEQVRQQSKDLAQNVRKKIAKQSEHSINSFTEKSRPIDYKFQEVRERYDDCIAKCDELIDDEVIIEERKKIFDKLATERGERAKEKLQKEKNKQLIQKFLPLRQKKLVRDMEKKRSEAVVKLNKKRKIKTSDKTKTENGFCLNLCLDDEDKKEENDNKYECISEFSVTICSTDSERDGIENNTGKSPKKKMKSVFKNSKKEKSERDKKSKRSHHTSAFSPMKYTERLSEDAKKIKTIYSAPQDRKMQNDTKINKSPECTGKSKKIDKETDESFKKTFMKHSIDVEMSPNKIINNPIQKVTHDNEIHLKFSENRGFSPKSKRIHLRNKIFSTVVDTKPSVEYISSKMRRSEIEQKFHTNYEFSSSPENPRSPIFTNVNDNFNRSNGFSYPNQEFVFDSRISQLIDKRRRNRDLGFVSNNSRIPSAKEIVKETCPCPQPCPCLERKGENEVRVCICCKRTNKMNEAIQTSNTIGCSTFITAHNLQELKTKQDLELNSDSCPMCDNYLKKLHSGKNTETQSSSAKSIQIPDKPPVSLISRPCQSVGNPEGHTVQHYDNTTKYSATYRPADNLVERIPQNDLFVVVEDSEDMESCDKIGQREKSAEMRGQNALKKEKLKKEYEELMKQLPQFLKRERIRNIGKDKQEHHMTEERRKEMELKREKRIENLYEENFPGEFPVTIPRRKDAVDEEECKVPFKIIDLPKDGNGITVNVADWNLFPVKNQNPSTSCKSNSTLSEQNEEVGKENFKKLIKKLTEQKEQLEKEKNKFPKGSKLHKIILDLEKNISSCMKKQDETISTEKADTESTTTTTTTKTSSSQCTNEENGHKNKSCSTSEEIKKSDRILQETATQTTQSLITEPEKIDKVTSSCFCHEKNKNTFPCEKLCEIVIKVGEDSSNQPPKISINPMKENTSNKDQPIQFEEFKQEVKPQMKEACWKDVLHQKQNSTSTTTSTSYMTPPDFNSYLTKKKESLTEMLQGKPQQNNFVYNFEYEEEKRDPELLVHIRHLLKMTHASIEALNCSSASSVTTPVSDIFKEEQNKTVMGLKNICKRYNLKRKDLEQMFVALSSESSSSTEQQKENENKSISNNNNKEKKQPTTSCEKLYEEMTRKCLDKIESLSALIENLRNDQESTKYLDLALEDDASDSDVEDAVTKKLLEIDGALTERIRKLSNMDVTMAKYTEKSTCKCKEKTLEFDNSFDSELIKRYKSLLCDKHEDVSNNKFTPLVSDLESLPKLEGLGPYETSYRKPPPSKGLIAARKFNNDICQPHELSVINEVDSLVSSKNRKSSLSPDERKQYRERVEENEQREMSKASNYSNNNGEKSDELRWKKAFSSEKSQTGRQIISRDTRKNDSPIERMSYTVDEDIELLFRNRKCDDFPRLDPNLDHLKLLTCDKNVDDLEQFSPRSERFSPKETPIMDRQIRSEESSPRKSYRNIICSNNRHDMYEKGGEVLKRARELTSRIQNLSKSFDPAHNDERTKNEKSSPSNDDSDDVEKMLKCLGMSWGITTLRKTQQSLALTSSSTSSTDVKVDDGKNEYNTTSQCTYNDTSLRNYLQNVSSVPCSSSTYGWTPTQRTSTPVNVTKNDSTIPDSRLIRSGESELSSVKNKTNSDNGKL